MGSISADNRGIILDRGVLYASARTSGGNDTFHRVKEQTVHLFATNRSVLSEPLRAGWGKSRNIQQASLQAREQILLKVKESYGTVQKIGRPGASGT